MEEQEAKRRIIHNLLQAGKTTSEITLMLNCSRMAVWRVRKLVKETGDVKRRFNKPEPKIRTKQL